MPDAPDGEKRQRGQALSLVASGHAWDRLWRDRKDHVAATVAKPLDDLSAPV